MEELLLFVFLCVQRSEALKIEQKSWRNFYVISECIPIVRGLGVMYNARERKYFVYKQISYKQQKERVETP